MSNAQRRGPWSQAEDQYLMALVQNQGALNWVRIAQQLQSRTPKQCRERYHQNLKPTLNHEPISPEEGRQIEQLVGELGKRWAEIARRLNGRSDNAVKNWWNGSQNRRKRNDRRKVTGGYAFEDESTRGLYIHRPAHINIPRTLPPPLVRQGHPQSPSYGRPYGFETPLPSPSALSPGADSVDMAPPSLMSDSSSLYTTSPRAPSSHPGSPVIELPPLKNITGHSPHLYHPTVDSKLPRVHDLAPIRPDYKNSASPVAQTGSVEGLPPRAHLPTAPSSPTDLPSLRSSSVSQEGQSREKSSRINVSRLLN